MKVIHIVHGRVNPHGHNGISRVVYYLNKYEKLVGIDSQIWAIVDGVSRHYTYPRDAAVTVECYPRVRTPWGKNEIIKDLILSKDTIDLVHFHLIWFYDKNIIAAALKKSHIPYVITTHGTYIKPHAYTGKRVLARWLSELSYLRMADAIHILNREEGFGLKKYGYSGKTFVAYNGLDMTEINFDQNREYFQDRSYRYKNKFIWVGVLRKDKNLASLIQAVALLPHSLREKLICILVGPDYRNNAAKCLALAEKLGCLDNFDYIGPLYDQEKYNAITSADVFVLPSFSEGSSIALLEAMACKKPCLITNGCGFAGFRDKDFFIECEPYPEGIAHGIRKIITRKSDWKKMGSNAYRLVESNFNWAAVCSDIIKAYYKIVKESKTKES